MYIIVKPNAGIGNRLSTLGESIYYAIISRRYLIIDWSDNMFSVNDENIFYKYFDVLYDKKLIKHNIINSNEIPDYSTKTFRNINKYTIHNIKSYTEDILEYTNYVGSNRNRDMYYIKKYIQIKTEYLKIPYEIISRLNRYIAIHIRYTDKKCDYSFRWI